MNEWSNMNGLEDLLDEKSCSINEQDQAARAKPESLTRVEVDLGDQRNGGMLNDLAAKGIRPLFKDENDTGAYVNQKEQFWHRAAAFLKAQGHTNVKVAELMNRSPVTINYLMKQPFMEAMILELQHEKGDEALEVLAAESLYAAQRLIEIAKTAENEETKRKANNDILDRKYGKPNQPMSVRDQRAEDVTDADLLKIAKN